jgi:predicted dehydrogenase
MTSFHRRSEPLPFTRRRFLVLASTAVVLPGLAAEAPPKFKAAVIGHTGRGDYGHGLESIFADSANIDLVAIADPVAEGRAKVANKISAPRQYADYREMLANERPQLVSLAMRQADLHHAIALEALRGDAHLYCEKPFVTAPNESDELLAEADKRGLKIAVAHTMRMMPSVVRLKEAIAQGFMGDVVEVRAYGKQDSRAGGEDMMVLGTHLFDLLRLFLGDPVSCTARVLWRGRDITPADRRIVQDNVGWVAGDQVFAQFAFRNGVNATFTSAAKLRETVGHWGIEFLGSKGAARVNCDIAPNVFVRQTTPWKTDGRKEEWQSLDTALIKSPPARNFGPVGDWLDAIARNREPACSGRNGAWAVEMVMAVYDAAVSGKRVAFPLTDRRHPLAPV